MQVKWQFGWEQRVFVDEMEWKIVKILQILEQYQEFSKDRSQY